MSFDDLLIHTFQLGTQTTSSNTLGEILYYWTYPSVDTYCRFVPITFSQRIELAGKFDDVRFKVYFDSGAAISGGRRLQHSHREYIVRDAYYDSSYHHIESLVAEVP
jgi:hypothetical protein